VTPKNFSNRVQARRFEAAERKAAKFETLEAVEVASNAGNKEAAATSKALQAGRGEKNWWPRGSRVAKTKF